MRSEGTGSLFEALNLSVPTSLKHFLFFLVLGVGFCDNLGNVARESR